MEKQPRDLASPDQITERKKITIFRKPINDTISLCEIKSVWKGELKCQAHYKSNGQPCRNQAYFLDLANPAQVLASPDQKKYVCGVHSKKATRQPLPPNPQAGVIKEQLILDRQKLVDQATAKNHQEGLRGNIICSKL